MSLKAASVNHTAESSKKCLQCGLRNFADTNKCKRCRSDLLEQLVAAKNEMQMRDNSGQFGRLKINLVLLSAAGLALLLGLGLFYTRQDAQGTKPAATEAGVAQTAPPLEEQPTTNEAQEKRQSEDAAKQVLAGLKRFQDATEGSLSYEEYDEMLTRLKADLNNTLPSFVDHNPSDEAFRQEVDAAVRDYTAAGNWWKTTIRNSAVFDDADRTERLIASWTSAKTHLYNAEKMLVAN